MVAKKKAKSMFYQKKEKQKGELKKNTKIIAKSLNLKDGLKHKLTRIKKQIETDFRSKYKVLQNIDKEVRGSESKLRNLIKPKLAKRRPAVLRNSLSEQLVQDTINKYSKIYLDNFNRDLKKTDNEIKSFINRAREPFKRIKINKKSQANLSPKRNSKVVLKINNYQVRKSNFISMINTQKRSQRKANQSLFLKLSGPGVSEVLAV